MTRSSIWLNSLLIRTGLTFSDRIKEKEFQEYLDEAALNIARFSMGLAVFTYAAFGVWDLTSAMGGLHSTRFRYMVACPALAAFAALSYRPAVKRYWQSYTLAFCIVAIICLLFQIIFHDAETEFKIARGNATLTLMLATIFSALFPISMMRMLLLQFVIQIVHAVTLIYDASQTLSVATFDAFYISCASTVVGLISYWRELLVRRGFAAWSSNALEISSRGVVDDSVEHPPAAPLLQNASGNAGRYESVRITISYRRQDSGVITGRIFDRLSANYGSNSVFRDIDHIPPGVDFRKHLEDMLGQSDVVVAIIGPAWVGPIDNGNRFSNPTDPVRVEIEAALRKRKVLIPVLVLGASMPAIEQLPEELQDLAFRHAVSVDAGLDFDVHMGRLIRAIDRLLNQQERPSEPLTAQSF